MTETYINNQNISNNIIINNPNYNQIVKKTTENKTSLESYPSYNGNNNETVNNKINDPFSALTLEDPNQKEEDIDHLRRFHEGKKNIQKIPFPYAQSGKFTINPKHYSKVINPITVDNKLLNRSTSGKIISLPKNTNAVIPNEKKKC